MRLLSLDPGGTTGWVIWEGKEEGVFSRGGYRAGHMAEDKHDHHLELKDFIEFEHSLDLQIVCESFEYRQRQDLTTVSLVSKEYIGVLKLIEQERKGTLLPVVYQTAAKGKGFFGKKQGGDEKIRKLGLWLPGQKHAMDAMRHLLYYRVFGLGHIHLLQALR